MSYQLQRRIEAFLEELREFCGRHGVLFHDGAFRLEIYDAVIEEVLESADFERLNVLCCLSARCFHRKSNTTYTSGQD